MPNADNRAYWQGFTAGALLARGVVGRDAKRPGISIRHRDLWMVNRLRSALGGTFSGPYKGYYIWHLRGDQLKTAALPPLPECPTRDLIAKALA